jgi:hypothetical protein
MRVELSKLRERQRQTEQLLTRLSYEARLHNVPAQVENTITRLRNMDSAQYLPDSSQDSSEISTPAPNKTTYPKLGDFKAISQALAPAQNAREVYSTHPFADGNKTVAQGQQSNYGKLHCPIRG